MASPVPVKSQSLYHCNFSHPQWRNDGDPLCDATRLPPAMEDSAPSSGNLVGQSSNRGEPPRLSSILECTKQPVIDQGEPKGVSQNSELGIEPAALSKNKGTLIEYRRNHSTNSSSGGVIKNGVIISSGSEQEKEKFLTQSDAGEADSSGNKRGKLLIRLPYKIPKQEQTPQSEQRRINHNDEHDENVRAQDEGKSNSGAAQETKTWNLRPRKGPLKPHCATASAGKNNDSGTPEKSKAEPLKNAIKSGDKEGNCGGASEKKVKRKLSISVPLTKGETEADIFAVIESKPSRRPKKRARNIQKQVENISPGMWLVSITTDSYKVSESSLKG